MRRRIAWHALVVRGRWWLRRLDRETPAWMQWLTPWGTSLVLHVALLLLFAFALFVEASRPRPNPPTSTAASWALTSSSTTSPASRPTDRAGDPFTMLDSIEPPSFALLPDPVAISAMELPPEHQIAPLIELNPRPRDASLPSLDGPPRPIAALGSCSSSRLSRAAQARPAPARPPRRRHRRIGTSGRTRARLDRPPPEARRRLVSRLLRPVQGPTLPAAPRHDAPRSPAPA